MLLQQSFRSQLFRVSKNVKSLGETIVLVSYHSIPKYVINPKLARPRGTQTLGVNLGVGSLAEY